MAETFYEIAEQLDQLKQIQDPTNEDMSRLAKIIAEPEFAKYFFDELDNPEWVPQLYRVGWFANPPAPQEDSSNPGYFTLPFWQAGIYLKAMAPRFPEIVKEVALNIQTENSRAYHTLLEAILALPPAVAAETVIRFDEWSNNRFSASMMLAHDMGLVLEYLSKEGFVEPALNILRVLTEPISRQDQFDQEKQVAESRHEFYWLGEAMSKNVPFLTQKAPVAVANLLSEQLRKAIEIENPTPDGKQPFDGYAFWRLNINPAADSGHGRDLKNLLVNEIIKALDIASRADPEGYSATIAYMLGEAHFIFRRISMFSLRSNGQDFSELVRGAYRSWVERPPGAWDHEFKKFHEAQFSVLAEDDRKHVIETIYSEAETEDFQEWMERVLTSSPEKISGETIEEKRQSFIEERHFRRLFPISQHLSDEDLDYFSELNQKYEMPEEELEPGVVVTSWEKSRSPEDAESLAGRSFQEIIEVLVQFTGEYEAYRRPSHAGMADEFEAQVSERYEEFLPQSNLLIRDDLRFIYLAHFFYGLRVPLDQGKRIDWTSIIDLCEFVSKIEAETFDLDPYEPGYPAAKLAMASVLEKLFREKDNYLESELLGRYARVIATLSRQNDPLLEKEVDTKDPREFDARTMNTNLDPATRSLNSVRGMAMHCLMQIALYVERKRKKEGGDPDEPVLLPLAKEILEEKLDKVNDDSLTVHAVIGWYFPQLVYLDRVWALAQLEKVFPIEEDHLKYFLAAWSAYVRFSDVYTNVFPELIDQYKVGVAAIEIQPKESSFDRIDERLAVHVLKAYILKLIDMGSEDELLRAFYEKAPDDVRAHGNFWLSQVLEAGDKTEESEVWQRIWALWQWRAGEAFAAKDKSIYVQEMQSFCRLLENAPVELDVVYPILFQSIEFILTERLLEYQHVIKYLAQNADKHLHLAVNFLHELLPKAEGLYMTSDTKENLRTIFEQAAASGSASTKEQVVEIINILGEQGSYEWRDYLNRLE